MSQSKLPIDPTLEAPIQWVRKNSRAASLAAIALLGGVLGIYLFVRSAQIRAVRAEDAYNEAQQLIYTGNLPGGQAKMGETATRYAGTNAGTMAAMRLAVARMNERKIGDAITILKQAQPKANKKLFGSAIHGLLAAALSDSGAYSLAADEYILAATAATGEGEKAALNYRAAELLAQEANKQRAVTILETLASGPPSEVRGKARKLLGEITTAPAKVGGTSGQ